MAFEPIKVGKMGGERTDPDKVYVAVYGNRDEGKPNHLAIRVGKDIAAQLGWAAGTKVAVYEGSNKDVGLLKLRPEETGVTVSATNPKKPNGAIMVLPQVGAFRQHDFPTLQLAEPVEAQAFGGEMLLRLPEWVVRKDVG